MKTWYSKKGKVGGSKLFIRISESINSHVVGVFSKVLELIKIQISGDHLSTLTLPVSTLLILSLSSSLIRAQNYCLTSTVSIF